MKKILILAFLVLGGCSTLQNIGTGISLVTKSVANPVTKAEETQVEIAFDAAVDLLRTYKADCQKGIADKNCRNNVAQIQVYTRKMTPLVVQLRGFVDNNDQIDATVVYNQLSALYVNAKGIAAAAGVNVGALP
jgi:hypothetical protein